MSKEFDARVGFIARYLEKIQNTEGIDSIAILVAKFNVLESFRRLGTLIEGDVFPSEDFPPDSWELAKQLNPDLLASVIDVAFSVIETSDSSGISKSPNDRNDDETLEVGTLFSATQACVIALQLDAITDYNLLNTEKRNAILRMLESPTNMDEIVQNFVKESAIDGLNRLAIIREMLKNN